MSTGPGSASEHDGGVVRGSVALIRPADLLPDAEVVMELRSLLADAEAAKIRGFAFIALRSDQQVQWVVAGAEARCNYLRLHGLLGWLQTKMLERWEKR